MNAAVIEMRRKGPPPGGVRFLADGERIAVIGAGLEVWDTRTGDLLEKRPLPFRPGAWAPLPDGERILAGGTDADLRIMGPDGAVLAVCALDAAALRFLGSETPGLWSERHFRAGDIQACSRQRLAAYRTACDVAVDRAGRRALAAYGQNFALAWCLETGRLLACLGYDRAGQADQIYRVSITDDGRLGLCRSLDGRVRVWDIDAQRETARLRLRPEDDCLGEVSAQRGTVLGTGGIGPAAFLGQDVLLAAVDEDLVVQGLRAGGQLGRWEGHAPRHPIMGSHATLARVLDLRVCQEAGRALTVGVDATLRLWDCDTGDCLWVEEPAPCCMDWADLSPDGTAVAWTGCPGTRVWRFG